MSSRPQPLFGEGLGPTPAHNFLPRHPPTPPPAVASDPAAAFLGAMDVERLRLGLDLSQYAWDPRLGCVVVTPPP